MKEHEWQWAVYAYMGEALRRHWERLTWPACVECYTCVAFPVWRRGSLVSHCPMEGATKEVRVGVMRGGRLFVEAA